MEVDIKKKRLGYHLVPNDAYKETMVKTNFEINEEGSNHEYVDELYNEGYEEESYPFNPRNIKMGKVLYCATVSNMICAGKKLSMLIWQDFENFIAERLIVKGWKVFQSAISKNGGVNIINKKLVADVGLVRCITITKKYSQHRPVGIKVIHELLYQVQKNGATKGLIFITSKFTKDALELLEENKAILDYFDGDMLEAEVKLDKFRVTKHLRRK